MEPEQVLRLMLAKGSFPSADFAKILQWYLDERSLTINELELALDRKSWCADKGTPRWKGDGSLGKHLSGYYTYVSFDLADEVLCRLHLQFLWHEPPLNEWYEKVDLRSKEERRLARQERKVEANRKARHEARREKAAA